MECGVRCTVHGIESPPNLMVCEKDEHKFI